MATQEKKRMAVVDYSGQILAINSAIASGVTSVSYEGKSVSYRSFDEMIKTVAYLQRLQDRANGVNVPVVGLSGFRRGYRPREWFGV